MKCFLLKTGRIKLSKVDDDGSEVTLDFRKVGDFIGENILTGQEDYPLRAWALEDTITPTFHRTAWGVAEGCPVNFVALQMTWRIAALEKIMRLS